MSDETDLSGRMQLLRSAQIPLDNADLKRAEQSLAVSLASLDAAVKGSLFDTEPQSFDVVLRRLVRSRTEVYLADQLPRSARTFGSGWIFQQWAAGRISVGRATV